MRFIHGLNKHIPIYRFIRLRHRDFFTKMNRLRLRYIVGTVLIASIAVIGLTGPIRSSVAFVPGYARIAKEMKATPEIQLASVSGDHKSIKNDNPALTAPEEQAMAGIAPLVYPLPGIEAVDLIENETLPRDQIIKISAGGTVAGALQDIGISGTQAYDAVKAMSENYDIRSVKPGQTITVHLEAGEENAIDLAEMKMAMSAVKELIVARDMQGQFSSKVDEKPVLLKPEAASVKIETSLYGSAARSNIPDSIIAEMIKIYSYDVDFQRDIRRGDQIEVLYETYETEDGDLTHYGDIIYAKLNIHGKEIPAYRYKSADGTIDYYRENGMSMKRLLMQTPIDGARISSGFGMRRHPVLGYNKMHKGIDFAASRGTPIYAAGDGVIEKAGRNGGYGNYIRVKHGRNLKTAYAHMKKFAKGMKKGVRVKQGQIIGYVGTTGRSTGPHLHFEVLRNGKHINPKTIKSFSGRKLAGDELKKFKAQVEDAKQQYALRAQDSKFAKNTHAE